MESLLWALDLVFLVFLCRWALRADMAEAVAERKRKQERT
jgi:hypothetical protein